MKRRMIPAMIALGALLTLTPLVAPAVAHASAAGQIKVGADKVGDTTGPTVEETAKNISNILLFLVIAVAVIMLIIGGFKYVVSQGDSSATQSAKNTILYAIIGIIVAIIAYAIVNFVVKSFAGGSPGGG